MLLIAHRGDTINFPENTIPAFRSAIEKGAGGFETDIQVVDNEVVVVHNYLARGNGPFPKLIEVLQEFGGKTHMELEIKSFLLPDVQKILEVLAKNPTSDTEVTSSVLPILPYVRKALPSYDVGAIFKKSFIEDYMTPEFIAEILMGYAETVGANVIHLPPQINDASIITTLKKRFRVHHHIFTAERKEYEKIRALGPDRATVVDIRLFDVL